MKTRDAVPASDIVAPWLGHAASGANKTILSGPIGLSRDKVYARHNQLAPTDLSRPVVYGIERFHITRHKRPWEAGIYGPSA